MLMNGKFLRARFFKEKKMRSLSFVLLLALAVAAQAQPGEIAGRASIFKYDHNSPVNFKEVSSEKRGDVVVRDITFSDGRSSSAKAYLVVPPGQGPFAGILWVHWLGAEKSNRTQFLDEAVGLAQKGVVSLLVDAMWAKPRWFGSRIPDNDYENSIHQVIELRRALDLLLSQSQVDRTRIGYVGHDYGAMYGMLMAGVDNRVKTYVFIAATQSLNDWAFLGPQPKSKAAYLKQNANLELTDYLRQSKNASTFFQFGKADFYVSQADAAILFAAANEPKQRRLYEAPHEMGLKEIESDRDEWLVKELKLGKQE
jgi:dienelactone hydrolase